MLQTINGKRVYVVEFDTMPELPITGLIREELVYDTLLRLMGGSILINSRRTSVYAQALTAAIETGVITEPGKYGIHVDTKTTNWNVFKIIE